MSSSVAVVTDIHAIAELGIETIYCGGDLVGYGPHPNDVCGLIEQRRIPTIYGNYDYAIGRDLHDCGCAYRDPHDREIGQLSVEWTLTHASDRAKGSCGSCLSTLASSSVESVSDSCTALPGRSTSTSSRTSPPEHSSASRLSLSATFWSSGTGTSLGFTSAAASCSSTAARLANRKTATRGPRSRSCARRTAESMCRSRVPYDALSVAREMRTVGLPDELAEKLVEAA